MFAFVSSFLSYSNSQINSGRSVQESIRISLNLFEILIFSPRRVVDYVHIFPHGLLPLNDASFYYTIGRCGLNSEEQIVD